MVVIRPAQVTFGGEVWGAVDRVTIDRVGTRLVREWSDDGPHLVFADVAAQVVRARVTQALDQTTLTGPLPGELEELRVELAAGGDEGRRLVRFDAVVESVTHEVSGSRAVRTVSLIAVSDEGDEDPVRVSDAS